jgi:predicted nucleic acid-binding Zn ribbon protein
MAKPSQKAKPVSTYQQRRNRLTRIVIIALAVILILSWILSIVMPNF